VVATFGVLLLLWVISWVSQLDSTPTMRAVGYLSILDHLDSFSKGVLDSKDAFYFLSMIFLGLFLTGRSMESIRWRA
jgi:ABC-2 type transport system permease protein